VIRQLTDIGYAGADGASLGNPRKLLSVEFVFSVLIASL
jgi:hypothetical protein